MHFLLIILYFLGTPLYAADDCSAISPDQMPLPPETKASLTNIRKAVKSDFKRRIVNSPGYTRVLAFDTNFIIPLVGEDPYFGQIYLTTDPNVIKYRDEMIAEKRFKEESAHPDRVYYSGYRVSEINSPQGLALVKAAGAEVLLKSNQKFTTTAGGRLSLRVKVPMQKPMNFTFDVVITKGRTQTYLIQGNQRIPFESIKINAAQNFFGSPSILSGIDNIQFIHNGRISQTIKP